MFEHVEESYVAIFMNILLKMRRYSFRYKTLMGPFHAKHLKTTDILDLVYKRLPVIITLNWHNFGHLTCYFLGPWILLAKLYAWRFDSI